MSDSSSVDPDRTAIASSHPRILTDNARSDAAVGSERYAVGEVIARGGMGEVYEAHDAALNRRVAVKVVLAELTGAPEVVRRFTDEARITAQLQHPGIPPVHDLGTLPDGRPFLAMKLIQGRTLAELLRERPAPAHDRARFVQAFEQVCQTVAYAHSKGVVHRDLKPLNLMVGAFGEVQVMDWGIAKVLTDTAAGSPEHARPTDAPPVSMIDTDRDADMLTQAGTVVGTRLYMPPEQARGEVHRVGPWSDVFALGGILCQILTGAPPYTGTSAEIRARAELGHVDAALARLEGCGAEPELVALTRRCLAPDPADRPADAGELAGLVAAYRAGVEGRLRRAETDRAAAEARAAEQRKRRRVQLALAAAVGVILLGGGAAAWWQDRKAAERRTEAIRQQAEQDRRDQAERERLAGNGQAIESLIGQCEDALRGDDAARAALLLGQAERRAGEGGAEPFQARLASCRTDLDALKELDRIDDLRWTVVEGRLTDPKVIAAAWAAVFRRLGVAPGDTPPAEAARRIDHSAVRDRLLAAVELWLGREPSDDLLATARAADPDPYRDDVRAALRARNARMLQVLADRPEALRQPARFAVALGTQVSVPAARRNQILQTAYQRQPGSLPVLMALGGSYPRGRKEGALERVGWYRAARAVRPTNSTVLNNLGLALSDGGDREEAIACYREVIRLDPTYVHAHNNLGVALRAAGDLEGAIQCYTEAIDLDPTYALAHNNLGNALRAKGNLDGAIQCYLEAIRLDPAYVHAHNNLGVVLKAKGDLDGAILCYREAVRIDPTYVHAHNNLGTALATRGDLDGAIASYREAIRLDPKYAIARENLEFVLRLKAERDAKTAPPPRPVKR